MKERCRCVEVVKEKLFQSTLIFENLNWKEIALYLKFNLADGVLRDSEFWHFIPTRRRPNGRLPKFTSSGSMKNKNARHASWTFVNVAPDVATIRRMFCEAIGVMVKRTMELHDFQLDGQIYRQEAGGAIGMDLTGVLSDIYMIDWDKQLIRELEEKSIIVELYKRYKDDVNIFLDVEACEEDLRQDTMARVKDVADGIDPALNVTVKHTSDYADERLPVLDLKVWVGEDVNQQIKVLHTHYMK